MIAGIMLGAVIVLLAGLHAQRPARVARVILWAGLLVAIGIRPPRRVSGEVVTRPVTLANGLPVAILILAIIAAIVMARVRVLPLTKAEKWLLCFLCASVTSAAWSAAPTLTMLRAFGLIATYVALMVLARIDRKERSDPLAELNIVVHLIIVTVLIGLLLTPAIALSPIPGALAPVARLKGVVPYVHPNALAFVATIGITLVACRVPLGHLRSPGARAAILFIDLSVILATRTRSALAYLLLAAAATILLDPVRRRRLVILIPAIAALVVVALTLTGHQVAGFVAREQTTEQLTGLTGRLEEWRNALNLASATPLIGNGYYAGHRFGQLAELEGDFNTTTDNAWVDVTIDVGLLGLVPLAGFVLTGAASLWRQRSDPRARIAIVVFLIGAVASLVNPSLNESNFWMMVWGWIILGVGPWLGQRHHLNDIGTGAGHPARASYLPATSR